MVKKLDRPAFSQVVSFFDGGWIMDKKIHHSSKVSVAKKLSSQKNLNTRPYWTEPENGRPFSSGYVYSGREETKECCFSVTRLNMNQRCSDSELQAV